MSKGFAIPKAYSPVQLQSLDKRQSMVAPRYAADLPTLMSSIFPIEG